MSAPDPRHPLVLALIKARHDADLTQAELSERLGYRSPSAVGNWEAGLREPRVMALQEWAQALGLRVALVPEVTGG